MLRFIQTPACCSANASIGTASCGIWVRHSSVGCSSLSLTESPLTGHQFGPLPASELAGCQLTTSTMDTHSAGASWSPRPIQTVALLELRWRPRHSVGSMNWSSEIAPRFGGTTGYNAQVSIWTASVTPTSTVFGKRTPVLDARYGLST